MQKGCWQVKKLNDKMPNSDISISEFQKYANALTDGSVGKVLNV